MIPRRPRAKIVDNTRKVSYSNYGGIDISSSNDTISDFNTPDLLNMLPNNKGDLEARKGIKIVHDFNSDFGVPSALFNYKNGVMAVNGEGFSYSTDFNTFLYGYLEGPYSAFEYNSNLYMLTRTKFLVFNGTTITEVAGYIPTRFINTPSTGGGTFLEDGNMIQQKSAQEFQKLTTETTYQFFAKNITEPQAFVRNVSTGAWDELTITTHFTVNLATGLFTITAAIPLSSAVDGNDVVRLIAKETTTGFGSPDTILKCTISAIYGGQTRISAWFSGNPDYPNMDFHSGIHDGLSDPTYFPLTEYDEIGFDDQSIIAYQNQGSQLIIYKSNPETGSESTWVRGTSIVGDTISFYHQELNSTKGCISTNSTALVNNSAWAFGKDGFGKVVPREVLAENSIEIQSRYVNYNKNTNFSSVQGLLESNYNNEMTVIDFDGKLYCSKPTDNQVWVCDYNNVTLDRSTGNYVPQWYLLNNMAVFCWVVWNGELHFGVLGGALCKFKKDTDSLPNEDQQASTNLFGPYPSKFDFYWTTKLTNLGTLQYKEDVEEIYISMKGYSDTLLNIWTRSDIDTIYQLRDTHSIKSFTYSSYTYSTFVYGGTLFPKGFRSRIKLKNVEYVQVKIGGTTGLPATLTDVEINISEGKEVR